MSAIGKLKPLRQYSEFEVINWFSLNAETGAKGSLVSIQGSGAKSDALTPVISLNLAAQIGVTNNAYSPQYEIQPKVRMATSGEVPFGMMLNDVLKEDAWGHRYRWDATRKAEREAVVSGEAVPIVQRGYFLIGPFGTGTAISGGSFLGVSDTVAGDYKVQSSATNACGEFFGPKDADGYALVYLNCHKV